jgi:hypothetical protein
LPWLAPAAGAGAPPRAGWFALLLIPLYALVCAGLAVRRPRMAAAGGATVPMPLSPPGSAAPALAAGPAVVDARRVPPGPAAAEPEIDPDRGPASPTAPTAVWITDPPEVASAAAVAAASAVAAARPETPASAELPVSAVPPEPPEPPAPQAPPEPPAPYTPRPTPVAAPSAEATLGEARLAADEIGRRVLGSSGLLDSCCKLADAAQSDLEALLDEERYAQKLLSTMRTRLVVLDQRCQALAQAALQAQPDDAGRAEVDRLVQAAQAQVLHCHQLAERLGAVERGHGPRMHSLRRALDLVAGRVDRVLRDAQQLMKLTRRITGALGGAPRACGPAEASASTEPVPPPT